MLTLLNAQERSAAEFEALFTAADPRFRFVGVTRPKGCRMSIVEAVWEGEDDVVEAPPAAEAEIVPTDGAAVEGANAAAHTGNATAQTSNAAALSSNAANQTASTATSTGNAGPPVFRANCHTEASDNMMGYPIHLKSRDGSIGRGSNPDQSSEAFLAAREHSRPHLNYEAMTDEPKDEKAAAGTASEHEQIVDSKNNEEDLKPEEGARDEGDTRA